MDAFEAGCEGTGLALAAGALAGAPGRREARGAVLALLAAAGGAALFALSLSDADHAAWPGIPIGALFAVLSYWVWRDVSASASAREQGASAIAGLIALAALVTAGAALLLWPVGLLALAGTLWLLLGRRRRATRKYEGLRSLR